MSATTEASPQEDASLAKSLSPGAALRFAQAMGSMEAKDINSLNKQSNRLRPVSVLDDKETETGAT